MDFIDENQGLKTMTPITLLLVFSSAWSGGARRFDEESDDALQLDLDCRVKARILAGPEEFGSKAWKSVLAKKALNGLKSSGAALRACNGLQAELCQPTCLAATGSEVGWLQASEAHCALR